MRRTSGLFQVAEHDEAGVGTNARFAVDINLDQTMFIEYQDHNCGIVHGRAQRGKRDIGLFVRPAVKAESFPSMPATSTSLGRILLRL